MEGNAFSVKLDPKDTVGSSIVEIEYNPIIIDEEIKGVTCFSVDFPKTKIKANHIENSKLGLEAFKRISKYSASDKQDLLTYILFETTN